MSTSRAGFRRLRLRPMFAWYDLWVGVFIDRAKRRAYVFPLPCLGVVVDWSPRCICTNNRLTTCEAH